MKYFSTLLLIFILSQQTFAEYRVFVLKITKKIPPQPSSAAAPPATVSSTPEALTPPPEVFRLETTTLDPYQYPGYYKVEPDEFITIQSTWMCPGRTSDFKAYCPEPEKIQAPNP